MGAILMAVRPFKLSVTCWVSYKPLRTALFSMKKDPTLTFIGGLTIGSLAGALIGACLMGSHIISVLGL